MTTRIAPHQGGPHVWIAADHGSDTSWVWRLTAGEIHELLVATEPHAGASDYELAQLTPESFSLPSLMSRLQALRRQLTHGRGFEIIRGLPIDRFPDRWATAVFAGLGSHLGSLQSQNAAGELIGQVRDHGADSSDPTTRIYQTAERQTFHTDSADVVGLLCLSGAAQGGESLLVSVAAVYNEMLSRDPDLAAGLFDTVATDRRGEVPNGAEPFFSIPVLSWYGGALTVMYQRQYIESAQRHPAAPPLDSRMRAALDLFDEVLNEPTMSLRMTLEPGDMQFVHNHSLLHDRTGFLDDPASPRHLLRLWLSVPGDRALPPVFAQRFGSVEVGDRGGIVIDHSSPAQSPRKL